MGSRAEVPVGSRPGGRGDVLVVAFDDEGARAALDVAAERIVTVGGEVTVLGRSRRPFWLLIGCAGITAPGELLVPRAMTPDFHAMAQQRLRRLASEWPQLDGVHVAVCGRRIDRAVGAAMSRGRYSLVLIGCTGRGRSRRRAERLRRLVAAACLTEVVPTICPDVVPERLTV